MTNAKTLTLHSVSSKFTKSTKGRIEAGIALWQASLDVVEYAIVKNNSTIFTTTFDVLQGEQPVTMARIASALKAFISFREGYRLTTKTARTADKEALKTAMRQVPNPLILEKKKVSAKRVTIPAVIRAHDSLEKLIKLLESEGLLSQFGALQDIEKRMAVMCKKLLEQNLSIADKQGESVAELATAKPATKKRTTKQKLVKGATPAPDTIQPEPAENAA